jgi:tellurite resistance protein TehA-like permease
MTFILFLAVSSNSNTWYIFRGNEFLDLKKLLIVYFNLFITVFTATIKPIASKHLKYSKNAVSKIKSLNDTLQEYVK